MLNMRTVFITASIIVFLLFVGANVYRTLPPWTVECHRFDEEGRLTSTARTRIRDRSTLQRFIESANKRNEKCIVAK